jgi:iron complex outermembrane recepter protein
MRIIHLAALGAVAACLPAAPASAQAPAVQPRAIEEIVVTARGREETVRDIPVAITAVSGDDLERYNLTRFDELGSLIPQLDIVRGNSGSGASINMRGIGSTFTSIGIEQSVAVILDGVYYPQGRVINEGLFDVEQVAVLKGPQALYFGKNASAGVISLATRNPGDEVETILRAGYEFEQQRMDLEGIISAPITNNVGARLALRGTRSWDGYMKNSVAPTTYTTFDAATFQTTVYDAPAAKNDKWPREESLFGRLTLGGDLDDSFSWNVKASFSHFEAEGPDGQSQIWNCPTLDGQSHFTAPDPDDPGLNMPVPNPDAVCGINWEHQRNSIPPDVAAVTPILNQFGGERGEEYRSHGITANLDYAFPRAEVTMIANYHKQKTKWVGDFDFTGAVATFAGEQNEFEAFSTEIRAVTQLDGPLNFVLGGYYQNTDRDFVQDVFTAGVENSAAVDPKNRHVAFAKISGTEGETWSGYGEVIWDIAPRWQLTLGTRYLRETKDSFFLQPYVNPLLAAVFLEGLIEADQKFTNWSPEATLRWEATDNVTLYGAYKQGFKSGGFSNSGIISGLTANPLEDAVFEPEEVEGFEFGLKSSHFDGTLSLEAEAYYYEFKDLQIDFFNSPTFAFITENAGKAETTGAEAQVTWLPPQVDGLSLYASLAYNIAEYKDFIAPCFAGQTPAMGCTIFTPGEVPKQQLSGTKRPLAPEWSGALRAVYERPLGNGLVVALAGNVQFKDDHGLFAFGHPADQQSAYATVDATLGLRNEAYTWQFELIGRNLTDKFAMLSSGDTPSTGGNTGTDRGFFADRTGNPILPRTLALRLTYQNL